MIATDASAEQIRHAVPHPRIEYRVAAAERTDLDPASVDLVTVATAAHWFDHERFERELRRVVRPGGVLAVWTYHVAHVEGPCAEMLGRFYRDVVQPYFGPGARHVDRRYETLPVPGEPLAPGGPYFVTAEWTAAQILAFVSSWSGTQAYLRERGEDPLPRLASELEQLGSPDRMVAFSKNCRVFKQVHLTFHIGDSRTWMQEEDYRKFNTEAFCNVLTYLVNSGYDIVHHEIIAWLLKKLRYEMKPDYPKVCHDLVARLSYLY